MWGQEAKQVSVPPNARIIPTRVGTRSALLNSILYARDHPHACGDKINFYIRLCHHLGSSPRVWGQVLDTWNTYKNDRIIPTRVGTRRSCTHWHGIRWDHPHACGDKNSLILTSTLLTGSSPRVWGQEGRPVPYSVGKRIIPTRVGTSVLIIKALFLRADHPHACGDKYMDEIAFETVGGSSPRVWGQVEVFC